ncbi:early nodulin-like protein 1 [Oryza brachyantha]|uniref:early nodulin-like protein 1 n=1 Tax=Oryza brachyantha TaxID=4533 RepID=UPI001ADBF7EF|nr:early nodulin-like protein 1 [Oryza brachyantha]
MASRSCVVAGAWCFVLLHAVAMGAAATQYKVGGDGGWGVPGAGAESYNTWAEKTSFQIGDQLLFVYPKDKDSVLLVEPADYNACNTASYDKKFADGSTTVTLDRAGAFFFISGVDANCRANEKLIVMVANTTAAPPPSSSSSSPPSSPSSGAAGGAPAAGQAPPNAPATPAASGGGAAGAGANSGAGLTVAGALAGTVVASIAYVALAI